MVLTQGEVSTLLAAVRGDAGLAVKILYGCGLRVAEVLALRVKDVDILGGKLEVRDGKGGKCRVLTLPRMLRQPLEEHFGRVKALYEADRREGCRGWRCLMRWWRRTQARGRVGRGRGFSRRTGCIRTMRSALPK